MCPSIAVMAGGADGGGGGGKGPGKGSGKTRAGTSKGGENAAADSRGAPDAKKYPGCGTASHPVDVVTGRAFTHPLTDLAFPGPLPFSFERAYSAKMAHRDVGLGHGWAHTLGWEVEVERKRVTVWNEQGVAVDFPMLPVGGEVLGPWGWVLRREAWGFAVDAGDGLWHLFSEPVAEGRRYKLTAIEDRNRNRITITYDDGRLVEVRDSGGRVVRVKTTPEGRIASLEALNAVSSGRWIPFGRYAYDDDGNLAAATDADGYTARYEYDDDHRLTADTDRAGLTFHFVYDAKGRCVESWGDYGDREDPSLAEGVPELLADGVTRAKGVHHCRFTYLDDGYSEVADSTQVRRFFGNGFGLLDKRVEGGAVTSAVYDDQGFQLSSTDALEATTTFERDPRGRLLKVVEPLDRTTIVQRDDAGLPIEIVDPAGGVTAFERDRFGNVLLMRNALGAVTRVRYDERGLPVEVVDPLGGRWALTYDGQGNNTSVTQPNGAVWRYAYDALGRRVAITDPLGATRRNVYSDAGELVASYDAAGGVRRYAYDGEGHLVREVSPSGATTEYVWGGYHRLCTKRDANGNTIELRYNLEGELVLVRNGRGEEHRLEYDTGGRLVAETTFDQRTIRYKNDALGRVVRVETSGGGRTDYKYNALGELVERVYADDTKDTFAYDALGELVEAAGSAGVFRFERDATGRVVREAQLVGDEEHAVAIEYDLLGRRRGRSTSRGHVERIERDATGARARTVLDDRFEILHANDPLGREIERRLPEGGRIVSAFDAEGRLGRRRALGPAHQRRVGQGEPEWIGPRETGVTADKAYTYGADGEIHQIFDAQRGATELQYDPVGQLVAMVPPKARPMLFRYDAAGDLYEADPGGAPRRYERGRLVQRGATSYEWDAEGRLVAKRTVDEKTQVEAIFRYTWDAGGNLRAVETPSGEIVEHDYDPLGRRVEKRVARVAAAGERPAPVSSARFVWDGNVLVHEIRRSAQEAGDPIVEERTFCFEDGTFVPAAQRGPAADGEASAWVAYMNDPAGAPDRLVEPGGAIACELLRGPTGRLTPTPESRTTTPLRLQGQYEDAETGLAYNRFRHFDPEIGTFIAPDPIGLEGGLHPYAYGPNTVGWSDALGLAGHRSWNEFQSANAGKFGSRAEAGTAWKVYKETNRDCTKQPAIGRLADTEVAESMGYRRLNTPGWTPAVNDSWVQGGVDRGAVFYMASPPTAANLYNPPGSRFPETVYKRELDQLRGAGYRPSSCGTYMLPPGRSSP